MTATYAQKSQKLTRVQRKRNSYAKSTYNDFFKNVFPKTADKLGNVYTPLQIVDFILRSADWAARHELGIKERLGAEGIHMLDPFSGTGTFTARLIQLELIPRENLGLKYQEEIHANKLLLIAYYISAVNIEAAFSQAYGVNVPFRIRFVILDCKGNHSTTA